MFGCPSLELGLYVGDHLFGAIERTAGPASFNVGEASGEPGVDDAALLRSVLIVGFRKFRKDGDHAAGGPDFELLPALKARAPEGGRGNHNGLLVLEGNGHRKFLLPARR